MARANKFDENAKAVTEKKGSSYLKKITLIMSVLMGLGNSLVMSLTGTLMSGHFKIPMWLSAFGIAFIVAFILANVLPPKNICDKVLAKFGLESNGLKDPFKVRAINAAVSTLIFCIPVTLLMSVFMVNMAGKQIDKRIDKFNTDIASLSQEQQEKKDELAALENEHTKLQNDKAANEKKLPEMEAQLKELQDTKDEKIAEANAGVAKMEEGLTEINSGLEGLQSGIDQIDTQLKGFEAQIANAPNANAAEAMRSQMPIDNLTAQKTDLETQKADLEAQKTELEGKLAEAKGAETSIDNGIAELTKGIESIKNGITEQEKGIASQEEGIAALYGAITSMQNGIDDQTKARDGIEKPTLGKTIIGSEIACNLIGLVLNFFYMPFCLAITLGILGKHQGNLYENHIKWVK